MSVQIATLGDVSILDLPKVGFLSSRKVPPAAVMKCYDWATEMRDKGVCVMGGFQSPLERDVLMFLLKGKQPVIWVLAHKLWTEKNIPKTASAASRNALSDSGDDDSCLDVRTKVRKGWCDMNKFGVFLMVGMALVGAATCRADEKTTIRDSQGRIKATITTDRNGKKTIRDSLGRIQGTETTDRNGKTTYRDASGHVTGSQQTDRYGKTTYRDCLGRTQGTKTVDRNGKITWRDAAGRIQGTAKTDRYGKTTYRDGSGRIIGTRKVR